MDNNFNLKLKKFMSAICADVVKGNNDAAPLKDTKQKLKKKLFITDSSIGI